MSNLKDIARRLTPRWLWKRLRSLRMRRMLREFSPFEVEHVYAGVPLRICIPDPLARGWYDHDWKPLQEIDLLRSATLIPGARVFDLGAHQGIVACVLATHVGPTGEVVAVEALAHNSRACEKNRSLNDLKQVRVVHTAVADVVGEIEICTDLNAQVKHAGTTTLTVRVPTTTVDVLADRFGPPDVLFIDVEGYECHALRGARKVLETVPDMYIEVHLGCGLEAAQGSVAELFSLLPTDRYHLCCWTERDPTPRAVLAPVDCPTERFFLVARKTA